jgi:hypothetical protein
MRQSAIPYLFFNGILTGHFMQNPTGCDIFINNIHHGFLVEPGGTERPV